MAEVEFHVNDSMAGNQDGALKLAVFPKSKIRDWPGKWKFVKDVREGRS